MPQYRVETDELSSYKALIISVDEQKLLASDEGIIEFWMRILQTFPFLSQIAMRFCVTPASNTSSERDFSIMKAFCDKSSKMKIETIEALMYCTENIEY